MALLIRVICDNGHVSQALIGEDDATIEENLQNARCKINSCGSPVRHTSLSD